VVSVEVIVAKTAERRWPWLARAPPRLFKLATFCLVAVVSVEKRLQPSDDSSLRRMGICKRGNAMIGDFVPFFSDPHCFAFSPCCCYPSPFFFCDR
jgi:hypothetical protein